MSKIISCHQPNFIPYLGFFDKMQKSDVLVIRDEVLFAKKEFHNRNKIRISSNDNINNPKFKWISAPVVDVKDFIMHVPIRKTLEIKNVIWHKRLLNDVKSAYQRSKYFSKFFPEFEKIFDDSDEKLVDLNMKIIYFLKKAFKINTKIIMASELNLKPENYLESDASEDLAKICKRLGGDIYLSGVGGKSYLNLKPFEKEGIEVRFQDYKHPVYEQKFPNFIPYMSAIDALFCLGKLPYEEEEIKPLEEPIVLKA